MQALGAACIADLRPRPTRLRARVPPSLAAAAALPTMPSPPVAVLCRDLDALSTPQA
eukprot:CAMPEP_0204601844 /NCGR_PEP_ID=MMETSP0661-20131031/56297_1 /ASSEMBLY_ACC=CAM_ASM_000606 /TAXON_ID=109239 /ORGANISM="Alexandrium margalefi, Strain AMGDE01CS-322" /LENGTH=56 /DNA_ID=CAMNT_0051612767 /DNA_START=196 /DNA_END=362 /DNA_ORIENTATION=-